MIKYICDKCSVNIFRYDLYYTLKASDKFRAFNIDKDKRGDYENKIICLDCYKKEYVND